MAISPHGYPTYDPTVPDVDEAPMHCRTCERETEHTLDQHGEWTCEYEALHAAARTSLEEYVRESILEAFRLRSGWPHVSRREREIASEVAGMAERHVEDVVEVES